MGSECHSAESEDRRRESNPGVCDRGVTMKHYQESPANVQVIAMLFCSSHKTVYVHKVKMSTKHYWATVNIYGHNATDVINNVDKINLF